MVWMEDMTVTIDPVVVLHYLITIATLAAAVYVVTAAVKSYRCHRDQLHGQVVSLWQKVLSLFRCSATWFLGSMQIIGSAVLNGLDWVAITLHEPMLKEVLDKYFDPKIVGIVLLVSGFLVLWARARTLKVQPDAQ